MRQEHDVEEKVFQLNVDAAGRIVIPAGTKLREASRTSGRLVGVESGDGSLVIRQCEDVIREVQGYFRGKIPKGVDLVEELIAERRAEAARE